MKCVVQFSGKDSEETLQWLCTAVGIYLNDSEDFYNFVSSIDVELIDTPFVLEVFSQFRPPTIRKITSHGISFEINVYQMNDFGNLKSRIMADAESKIIFCPMSNVRSILVEH